jgi:hypothetical protein
MLIEESKEVLQVKCSKFRQLSPPALCKSVGGAESWGEERERERL